MYLYKFINNNDEIIYVGKTKNNIRIRLNQHFGNNGHLSNEDYSEVVRVEYAKVKSESDLVVYEPYYINLYKPKLNSELKKQDILTIQLPNLIWEEISIIKNNIFNYKYNFDFDFENIVDCILFKKDQIRFVKDLRAKEGTKLLKSIVELNLFFLTCEINYNIECEYDWDKYLEDGSLNDNYEKKYWRIRRL